MLNIFQAKNIIYIFSRTYSKYNNRINIIVKGLKFKESYILENTKL